MLSMAILFLLLALSSVYAYKRKKQPAFLFPFVISCIGILTNMILLLVNTTSISAMGLNIFMLALFGVFYYGYSKIKAQLALDCKDK